MRIGSVTGTRVARRMVSTLSIARTAATSRSIALGGHRERIPAADDDVAHLRVAPQPRERRSERLEGHGAVAAADHARAGAEAAVDGAAVGRQEKDAIGVALHEMRRDLVRALAERIDEVARHLVALARVGDALLADRARGIVGSTSDR